MVLPIVVLRDVIAVVVRDRSRNIRNDIRGQETPFHGEGIHQGLDGRSGLPVSEGSVHLAVMFFVEVVQGAHERPHFA